MQQSYTKKESCQPESLFFIGSFSPMKTNEEEISDRDSRYNSKHIDLNIAKELRELDFNWFFISFVIIFETSNQEWLMPQGRTDSYRQTCLWFNLIIFGFNFQSSLTKHGSESVLMFISNNCFSLLHPF